MDARDLQSVTDEAQALDRLPERPRSRMRRLALLAVLVPGVLLAVMVTLALVYSVVTPPSTLMLGRWLTARSVQWEPVAFAEISPLLVQAVVASEDQRFCLHRGIDWGALRQVVDDEEGPSRGASTVTMQVAKNVFLWSGRSYLRKALELPLALFIDALWGKRRVMEIYLNVAEWGDGVFGAEAAARHWFGKTAARLNAQEAAMLAAILPNPIQRSASRPSGYVRARAARIRGLIPKMGELAGCVRR